MIAKLEKEIEAEFVKLMEEHDCWCIKFTDPARAGAPDRIVLTPHGGVFFVEFKTEKGKLSAYQQIYIHNLYNRGFRIFVIRGKRGLETWKEGHMSELEVIP